MARKEITNSRSFVKFDGTVTPEEKMKPEDIQKCYRNGTERVMNTLGYVRVNKQNTA